MAPFIAIFLGTLATAAAFRSRHWHQEALQYYSREWGPIEDSYATEWFIVSFLLFMGAEYSALMAVGVTDGFTSQTCNNGNCMVNDVLAVLLLFLFNMGVWGIKHAFSGIGFIRSDYEQGKYLAGTVEAVGGLMFFLMSAVIVAVPLALLAHRFGYPIL